MNPANSIEEAIKHHKKHGDMDGHTCMLNRCELHYPHNEKIEGKWIYFYHDPKQDKPRTEVWNIYNKEYNDWLGVIAWFPHWYKYAFRSTAKASGEHQRIVSDIWLENKCLLEIVNFCIMLTLKHRSKKKGEKT